MADPVIHHTSEWESIIKDARVLPFPMLNAENVNYNEALIGDVIPGTKKLSWAYSCPFNLQRQKMLDDWLEGKTNGNKFISQLRAEEAFLNLMVSEAL